MNGLTPTPHLSIVVTARNDNHGGQMLRRMQIFLDGLLDQLHRFKIASELIIVEWNPPTDKPKLTEVLQWKNTDYCSVRIIEVPAELHSRFRHSGSLPLYQMIGKNVGIRRARGKFVLCTNIDLLFTDELIQFLGSANLAAGRIFRIDRIDVKESVPIDAPHEAKLEFCRRNILRVNRKGKTISHVPIAGSQLKLRTERTLRNRTYELLVALVKTCLVYPSRILVQAGRWIIPRRERWALIRVLPPELDMLLRRNKVLIPVKVTVPDIHTNACGDFTLMAKEDWYKLAGYAEFETYSMHIDSVLCHAAYHAGISEVVLAGPMMMFHIEHAGGWTPDTESQLNDRLDSKGISQMTYLDLMELDRVMSWKSGTPTPLNDADWGLANETLTEQTINQIQGQCISDIQSKQPVMQS